MNPILFNDLAAEHQEIMPQLEQAFHEVVQSSQFIQGHWVSKLEQELGTYFDAEVIGVANGTDALQIAMMALGLQSGDEVIIPGMTYYATAEAAAILGIIPVIVDVDERTFTMNPEKIEAVITDKTKAIIPVHLYGYPAAMGEILLIAEEYGLFVIEDTAQAFGAEIQLNNQWRKVGTIGDIGTLSFFPGKNLGALGDGGAVLTKNKELAQRIRMMANHGQSKRYVHDLVGCNSRLDAIQAAFLSIKWPLMAQKNERRRAIAEYYSSPLREVPEIVVPYVAEHVRPVFHQYTIRVTDGKRDELQEILSQKGIPTRVYYPIPVHQQKGLEGKIRVTENLEVTERLTKEILSLPVHSRLSEEEMGVVVRTLTKTGTRTKTGDDY